jgi:hypothetical protein
MAQAAPSFGSGCAGCARPGRTTLTPDWSPRGQHHGRGGGEDRGGSDDELGGERILFGAFGQLGSSVTSCPSFLTVGAAESSPPASGSTALCSTPCWLAGLPAELPEGPDGAQGIGVVDCATPGAVPRARRHTDSMIERRVSMLPLSAPLVLVEGISGRLGDLAVECPVLPWRASRQSAARAPWRHWPRSRGPRLG